MSTNNLARIAYWRIDGQTTTRVGTFERAARLITPTPVLTPDWWGERHTSFPCGDSSVCLHTWKDAKTVLGMEDQPGVALPGAADAIRERLAWPEASFEQLVAAVNVLAQAEDEHPLVLAVALATIKRGEPSCATM